MCSLSLNFCNDHTADVQKPKRCYFKFNQQGNVSIYVSLSWSGEVRTTVFFSTAVEPPGSQDKRWLLNTQSVQQLEINNKTNRCHVVLIRQYATLEKFGAFLYREKL